MNLFFDFFFWKGIKGILAGELDTLELVIISIFPFLP